MNLNRLFRFFLILSTISTFSFICEQSFARRARGPMMRPATKPARTRIMSERMRNIYDTARYDRANRPAAGTLMDFLRNEAVQNHGFTREGVMGKGTEATLAEYERLTLELDKLTSDIIDADGKFTGLRLSPEKAAERNREYTRLWEQRESLLDSLITQEWKNDRVDFTIDGYSFHVRRRVVEQGREDWKPILRPSLIATKAQIAEIMGKGAAGGVHSIAEVPIGYALARAVAKSDSIEAQQSALRNDPILSRNPEMEAAIGEYFNRLNGLAEAETSEKAIERIDHLRRRALTMVSTVVRALRRTTGPSGQVEREMLKSFMRAEGNEVEFNHLYDLFSSVKGPASSGFRRLIDLHNAVDVFWEKDMTASAKHDWVAEYKTMKPILEAMVRDGTLREEDMPKNAKEFFVQRSIAEWMDFGNAARDVLTPNLRAMAAGPERIDAEMKGQRHFGEWLNRKIISHAETERVKNMVRNNKGTVVEKSNRRKTRRTFCRNPRCKAAFPIACFFMGA